MQETIPWAPTYSRITYRLEWRLCTLCQIMTQKAAAEILKMPPSTLSDLLHRIITRVREGHKIRGLLTLGVDEISFLKGHKYATLVYDLDRSPVLWVGRGKGRETIDRFFNECLSKGQKERVLWASCDMSRAYTEAIKYHCPNTTLVIDRFHVVKALNQAVDEVRKDEWRASTPQDVEPSGGCVGCSACIVEIAAKGIRVSSIVCALPIVVFTVPGCSRKSSIISGIIVASRHCASLSAR